MQPPGSSEARRIAVTVVVVSPVAIGGGGVVEDVVIVATGGTARAFLRPLQADAAALPHRIDPQTFADHGVRYPVECACHCHYLIFFLV